MTSALGALGCVPTTGDMARLASGAGGVMLPVTTKRGVIDLDCFEREVRGASGLKAISQWSRHSYTGEIVTKPSSCGSGDMAWCTIDATLTEADAVTSAQVLLKKEVTAGLWQIATSCRCRHEDGQSVSLSEPANVERLRERAADCVTIETS